MKKQLLKLLLIVTVSITAQTTLPSGYDFEGFVAPFNVAQNINGGFFFQHRSHWQPSDEITSGPSGNTANKSIRFQTVDYTNIIMNNAGTATSTSAVTQSTNNSTDPTLDDGCYVFSAFVYIPMTFDNGGGVANVNQVPSQFSFAQSDATPFALNFDLSSITQRDQWVAVTSANFDASSINDSRFRIRVLQADFPTTTPENGGVFYIDDISVSQLSTGACATLSVNDVEDIPEARIISKNGSIIVEGANLDSVYALTGQQVGSENLPKGIYIVEISNGIKKATLKVVMD